MRLDDPTDGKLVAYVIFPRTWQELNDADT
jgi:hypothetical protein